MSDLKISEAAKQLVASFVDDNAWNGLSEHWKETASRTAQRIINSELDRIAGPLVEALEKLVFDLQKEPTRVIRVSQSDFKKAQFAVFNYHKNRGI